jgi:hypothetical protein
MLMTPPLCSTNRYLWVQTGQRVTSDGFRKQFEMTMANYCACDIKPSSYRQMAIGIGREHIHPQNFIEDNTADEAAHHSGHTAHGHYGIVEGDLPFLTADKIWRFRAFDREWHNILGVGMRQPPRPLRLLASDPHPSSCPQPPDSSLASPLTLAGPAGGVPVTQRLVEELSELVLGRVSELLLAEVQRTLMDKLVPALIEKLSVHMHPTLAVSSESGANTAEIGPESVQCQPLSLGDSSQGGGGDFQWTPIPVAASGASPNTTITSPPSDDIRSFLPLSSFSASTLSSSSSPIHGASDPAASVTGIWESSQRQSSQQSLPSTWAGSVKAVNVPPPQRRVGAIMANQRDEESHVEEGGGTHSLPAVGSKAPTTLHQHSHQHPHHDRTALIPSGPGAPTSYTEAAPPELDSESDLASRARSGIRLLFQDSKALEKSHKQLEYIMACILCQEDIMVILPTGGGKSAGWQVPAKLDPQRVSVVVTPYVSLLQDQLRSAEERGIKAQQFLASTPTLRENVQLVFIQPETVTSQAFKV